jgi:DNA-binding NarL/FixJ family response regulator
LGNCGTILVVDGDDATRVAVARVARQLECEVSAAENAELMLERLDDLEPAAAVVEVELPGALSGFEVMRELHERFGEGFPVFLVSAERTSPLDRTAGLMLGADDYLAKPFDPGELLARVRRSIERSSSGGGGNGNKAANDDVRLSPREREILELLAAGSTQAEIASALVISPKTVATHIQHLLAKLGVHSRAQAVGAAYRLGLVEPDVRAHALSAETT